MTEQVPSLVSSPTNILTIQDVVLDSPVWRANVLHLEEQIEQFEKWIDGFTRALKNYIEAINKHNTQASTLCKRTFFNGLDDNKMAGNVVEKFATTLQSTIANRMKMASDLEDLLLNPLQKMAKIDLKSYKDSRKQFEKTLDKYETQLNRYNVLSKQKEASALREDAFQMYELRKQYIRHSSDHFTKLVSFKANLEILLIECFSGALSSQIEEIDESAYSCSSARSKLVGWKQWLDESKMTSEYQMNKVKKRCTELQELYITQIKPHRSLKCYSTTGSDSSQAVSSNAMENAQEETIPATVARELNPSSIGVVAKPSKGKQGYLNSRIMVGKGRPPWVRRWFFLQEGWFGTCTVSTVNKEKGCIVLGDRIRISECIYRICTDMDRRYCFELTHPRYNFFLQAETEEEMQQWLRSIEYNMQEHETNSLPTSPQLVLSPKALVTDRFRSAVAEDSPRLVAISTSPLASPDGSQQKSLTPILSTTTSSLTTLMIREGSNLSGPSDSYVTDPRNHDSMSISKSTGSSSSGNAGQFTSWNMPWLTTGINAFSNSEEDLQQALADGNDPTQIVVWPNKLEMDVPQPQISHYSQKLETAQRELRKLFYNVPKDEIVVETFAASLYRSADDQCDGMNKSVSYGYSGSAYITQKNFWFYSCTLMTCVNMIVIPLQRISSISVENTAHSSGMLMLIEANVIKQKQTIRFGLWLENAEVISEKLKHAVSNATSLDENNQQLYDTIRSITSTKLHKNSTPASHVTTSSALYASVTPLTVQAQPVMMHPNASSTTNDTTEDAVNDISCSNQDNATLQQHKSSDEETSQATLPSAHHRGSPAQGALAAVAARNQKNQPTHKSSTPTRASTPQTQSNEDWPSHLQKPSGKVNCNCTDHLDKVEADLVLPVNSKQLFDYMFKEGNVWAKLNEAKNYGPPSVSEWQDNKRTLQYSMPVSNPMVKAKETDVYETQEIVQQKDYTCYVVMVTTKTPNLPYADAFVPTIKYCITFETPTSCRLVCSLGVQWLKSIFVKTMVNRAATKGMQETVSGIIPILKHEFDSSKRPSQQPPLPPSSSLPATAMPPPLPANRLKPPPSIGAHDQKDRVHFISMTSFVLAIVCILFTSYQFWIQRRYQHLLDNSNQMKVVWRGVYLKDMQKEAEKQVILSQVNETIFDHFQATRQGITQYNYHWTSRQHRLMAAELGYSRERLGAIRYELLSTFRMLNRVEYQLLETEYWNWISDKQLDCTEDCEALLKEIS
ncbi:hypothetical protein BD408DRAFT_431652 [Parasitella parasitica]|nr:hypothetical protein BD408DRAFT_431652 [Parasitella parasitica]